MKRLYKINQRDNVAIALNETFPDDVFELNGQTIKAIDTIDKGHKIAVADIKKGEDIIKYGYPIGYAANDIAQGEYIHTHNIKTKLSGFSDYIYQPELCDSPPQIKQSFMGYRRENGDVGIRNEIWIIVTVGCINKTAVILESEARIRFKEMADSIFAYTHPYGCSQLGEDQLHTQRILKGLVNHPNAAGILVLGLGCENNNIDEFKKILGDYLPERVKFLSTQEVEDEVEKGLELIGELIDYANHYKKEEIDLSQLVVGLKCGGSDAFSGITANPLVGRYSDMLIACGGTTILTEVPEMFGAEEILMNRCRNKEVFHKTVHLINDFKDYFIKYKQEIYENPSPGNIKGGITTLEEKSLGCVQKGGTGRVMDVISYGGKATNKGLNLLNGPGNDIVAVTALVAAGAHIVLFTTGRGTPLGSPIPTVKISSNTELARKKPNWIDFDAGVLLGGEEMDSVSQSFFEYILGIASGAKTKNEQYGYREIAIFKDGVTL